VALAHITACARQSFSEAEKTSFSMSTSFWAPGTIIVIELYNISWPLSGMELFSNPWIVFSRASMNSSRVLYSPSRASITTNVFPSLGLMVSTRIVKGSFLMASVAVKILLWITIAFPPFRKHQSFLSCRFLQFVISCYSSLFRGYAIIWRSSPFPPSLYLE